MTFTYVTSTSVGKIRLLISDTVSATAHFTDEELTVFLELNDNSINLAAASALESWASSLKDTTDSERIGDYSYTKKQVTNMLALAERLRDNESNKPAMDWAEMDLENFNEAEE